MRRAQVIALALGFVLLGSRLGAQGVRRDYHSQVPPLPRIGSQTEATARLSLFGDRSRPDYRDVAPADGMDDARASRLLDLAERFSPILRRNNFSVPRDFRTIEGMRLVLHADRWVDGVLVGTDSVDLSPDAPLVAGVPPRGADDPDGNDARLIALLREHDPRRLEPQFRPSGPLRETILYFDFPGEGEKSWRRIYRAHDPRESVVHAHPFIDERETDAPRRFSFVIQFWLFYPFNDGPNNHEGDWEHLNVAITTLQRAAEDSLLPERRGALSAEDIARIVDADGGVPLDSLTITWVNNYFHHSVITLDYLAPRRLHDYPRGWLSKRPTPPIWEDADFIDDALRARRRLAGGRLATHPFGYVGGNNRGPGELLTTVPRFAGSYNRNPHGTYPFPSTWRNVGALDAAEQVFGEVEPRIRTRPRPGADSIPWFDLIDDDHYVTYPRSKIVLVPDWERVADVMDGDPRVRRDWAWLVLPIHFGFPSTASPGAGAVARTNLGNVAPPGPAYNPGWNRDGETTEHHRYDPHVLRIAFAPVSPFTALQNGWGVLNIPIAAAALVPGVQVVLAQLMPWVSGAAGILGAPPGKTFYAGKLPTRFTSFGAGRFIQVGGDGFARLLPREEDDSIAPLLARDEARGARIDDRSYRRRMSGGNRIWLLLHYGDRLSLENAFAIDTTELSYAIRDTLGARLSTVHGELVMRQLSGGVRYGGRMFVDELRGYLRAGYGWTWYKLRDASVDGRPVETAASRGGHAPSLRPSKKWWPNSMYGGLGVELFAPRRAWIYQRLGYGIAAEVTALAYPLRVSRCHCILERGEAALSLVFGW